METHLSGNMRVIMNKVKKMEEECTNGKIIVSMMACGLTIKIMVLANIHLTTVINIVASGRKVS